MKCISTVYVVLAFAHGSAVAMGMEKFGNEDLATQNYATYPGAAAVVNHPSRVYHWWVNGNERCFFDADQAVVNDLIDRFAKIEATPLEVVLTPKEGRTTSFEVKNRDGSRATEAREIRFTCQLAIVQGIVAAVGGPRALVLTIHVDGDRIKLDSLKFPAQVNVVPPSEVQIDLLERLKDPDYNVRSHVGYEIVENEPYTNTNVPLLLEMTHDPHEYVRRCAAGALGQLGKHAESALDELRAHSSEDKSERESFSKAIKMIEEAGPPKTLSVKQQQMLQAIEARP